MLEVIKRWTCDLCFLVVEHERPKGWVWFRSALTGEIHHRCGDCDSKCAPEFKGHKLGTL